ncbi:MAG: hypothetical protein ABIO65_11660, partial [Nitrospiria bacterium]
LPTILSRCQHFHFKRVGRLEMIAQISRIASDEGLTIDERALSLVAKASEGSVRDGLSLIDQVVAFGGPTVQEADVVAMLGVVDREGFGTLTRAIAEKQAGRAIVAVRSMLDHGHDVKLLCADLVEYIRHLTLLKVGGEAADALDLPHEEIQDLRGMAGGYALDELQRLFAVFSQAQEDIRFAFFPPFTLEMALVNATRVVALEPIERLLARVEALGGPGRGPEARSLPSREPPAAKPRLASRAERPVESPVARSAGLPSGPQPDLAPDLQDVWRHTLKRVLDEKPNLGSYLEAGHLKGGGPDEIVLEYDAHQVVFGEMVSKEDNRVYVSRLLRELSHRELVFRVASSSGTGRAVVDRSGDRRAGAGARVPTPPTPSRRSAVSEVVGHPLVKEALDVFGGEVMEVRDMPADRPPPDSPQPE